MDFFRPVTWGGGPEGKAERAGAALLDLTRIDELADWERAGERLRIGAGVSYARVVGELGDLLPGLAIAARTVGSPQIRNRGTIGGAHPGAGARRRGVPVRRVGLGGRRPGRRGGGPAVRRTRRRGREPHRRRGRHNGP